MNKDKFDFETFKKIAAHRLKQGDSLLGREGVLTPLLKDFLEEALSGELEAHLEDEKPNRKDGKGRKSLKTTLGTVELDAPRDRNGTFEPELVSKRQRSFGVDVLAISFRFILREYFDNLSFAKSCFLHVSS